ncbi:MAG: (2Fe-2S) ferredoxin domain-containing protein [Oscillospiraceae bacterium]|nr:(2Fe-2S) ferredoxin domain-containing protein [Oscillospiraceae bacterium]
MIVQICVGSSCHLKGSERIVELLQNAITEHKLENEITLAGSFCVGQCNRIGVTVQVDDEVFTGVTPEDFNEFFNEHILKKL